MPAFTNATQTIPVVFEEIMKNDKQRASLKAQSVVPFDEWKNLKEDRASLRRDAEKALRWNVDKGNSGRQ